MWNPDDLAALPGLVHGAALYAVNPKTDYGRIEVFHRAAAANPPIRRTLNAASHSKYADVRPGELWWCDGSHKFERNADGDCRMLFFVDHIYG